MRTIANDQRRTVYLREGVLCKCKCGFNCSHPTTHGIACTAAKCVVVAGSRWPHCRLSCARCDTTRMCPHLRRLVASASCSDESAGRSCRRWAWWRGTSGSWHLGLGVWRPKAGWPGQRPKRKSLLHPMTRTARDPTNRGQSGSRCSVWPLLLHRCVRDGREPRPDRLQPQLVFADIGCLWLAMTRGAGGIVFFYARRYEEAAAGEEKCCDEADGKSAPFQICFAFNSHQLSHPIHRFN